VASWSFLTSHARVLMCIAHDPGARLRDIAAGLGITERSAYGIVTEMAEAGYVVKQKDGAATVTRSRRTSRSQSPLAGNARSARSWPFWPAPTPRRDRPERRTKAAASPAHRRTEVLTEHYCRVHPEALDLPCR
jgi:IclR helix-turn-helix domain